MSQYAIKVLGSQAASNWAKLAEALVLLHETRPTQDVGAQVCVAPA